MPTAVIPVLALQHNKMSRWRDHLLLGTFSFLLFGYSLIGGRPLTMHEGILPESACEMLADHDWVVPKSGGRPWLEKPPLPQWITATVAGIVGRCDEEWIVRLAPVLIGTGVVVLCSSMSAMWFGRAIGLLGGFTLSTMFEFTRYSRLAEADIFLCGLVTAALGLFVYQEFARSGTEPKHGYRFFGSRPWPVFAFFVLLGLTNLAKGPLFGTVMTLVPILAFLIWNHQATQIRRYVWLWGWAILVLIAMAWPLLVWRRYPDVVDLWATDYLGRLSEGFLGEPIWYYALAWTWEVAPWTFFAVMGLWLTRKAALYVSGSPERFLWCWAVLPIITLSIPDGKHHHYLVPCIPPWAVLSALGLVWTKDRLLQKGDQLWPTVLVVLWLAGGAIAAIVASSLKIPNPDWAVPGLLLVWTVCLAGIAWALARRRPSLAFGIIILTICGAYTWGYAQLASRENIADTAFLKEVPQLVRSGRPVMVNADLDSMDLFRILFYLRPVQGQVRPIHNLTFLLDDRLHDPEVYVISRFKDWLKLEQLGTHSVLLKSLKTRREQSPDDRLTLFALKFHADLYRKPAPKYISPMQAMGRERGPYVQNSM